LAAEGSALADDGSADGRPALWLIRGSELDYKHKSSRRQVAIVSPEGGRVARKRDVASRTAFRSRQRASRGWRSLEHGRRGRYKTSVSAVEDECDGRQAGEKPLAMEMTLILGRR